MSENSKKKKTRRFTLALVAIIALGFLFTAWMVWRANRELHNDLLHQAKLVAPAININRIQALTGTEADITSDDYLRLKEQLGLIRSADTQFRFIYLAGRNPDGKIFFFVDNERPDSKDYSPPGQIFEDASDELSHIFDSKAAITEGPEPDEWGIWVSALIPITDPATGKVIAVMGMDIDARDWKWKVASQAAMPMIMVFIIVIMLMMWLSGKMVTTKLIESQKRLSTFFESDMFGKIIVNRKTRFIFDINTAGLKMLGRSREDVIGKICHGFMCPAEEKKCPVCDLGQTVDNSERILLCSDGKKLPILKTVTPILIEGEEYLLESFTDITDRKKAEEKSRHTNEQLSIVVKRLKMQQIHGQILTEMREFLQACSTTLEIGPILEQSMKKLFPDSDGALFLMSASRTDLESIARWGNYPQSLEENVLAPDECWGLRRGGQYIIEKSDTGILCSHIKQRSGNTYACLPLMAKGEVLGLLHLRSKPEQADGQKFIDELKDGSTALIELLALAISNIKLREKLSLQSIKDPLTGLFNRRYLEETFLREATRARRKKAEIGVIMVDIDHFKKFNDVYGHAAGDLVLAELAKFFTAGLRGCDIVCRYGGEEFALILPDANLENTFIRARQLVEQIKNLRVQFSGQVLEPITLSMGVAAYPIHGEKLEDLLKTADMALYRAKQTGRDKALVADIPS